MLPNNDDNVDNSNVAYIVASMAAIAIAFLFALRMLMRKLAFFLLLFIFLGVGVWGQTPSDPTDKHIVYGDDNPFGGNSDYFHIDSGLPFSGIPGFFEQDGSGNLTITSSLGRNVYIVNVGDINTGFTVNTDGYIEFRGTNNITGTLTLNSGTGGVRLNDADNITTTGDFNTNGAELILLGTTNRINAVNITLGNGITTTSTSNLTLNATNTTGNITITGNIGTSSDPLGVFTVENGTMALGSNNLYATSIVNSGTITLTGATGQTVTPATISGNGLVHFNADGITLAGITNFTNITMSAGNRTLASNITVTGAFSINAGGTLNASSHTIALNGGTWNREGVFNHGTGTVSFTDATVNNDNIFNNVTCNGTVSFANGSTQTINGNMSATGANLTAVIPNAPHWNLAGLTAVNFVTGNTTTINWCRSVNFLDRSSSNTNTASSSNNINVFAGGIFVWVGNTSSDWNNDANWTDENGNSFYYPPQNNTSTEIRIPAATANPLVLNLPVSCGSMIIDATAVVDLSTHNLTVSGTLTNNGTLNLRASSFTVGLLVNTTGTIMLDGTQTITVAGFSPPTTRHGGTIRYQGNVISPWSFGDNYTNLIINNSLTIGNAGDLDISGNAEFGSPFTANSVNVAGDSVINADITTTQNQTYNGTVTLGGTAPRTLTSTGGNIIATGVVSRTDPIAPITIRASQGIELTGANTLNGTGTVLLDNTQGSASSGVISYNSSHAAGTSLTISAINGAATGGNITITATTGDLTIGAAANPAISTATQNGAVNITATAGAIVVEGNIGTNTARNGAVVLNANTAQPVTINGEINCYSLVIPAGTETININNNVTTYSDQTYHRNVTLGGGAVGSGRIFTGISTGSPGSTLTFNGTVNGQRALTITDANVVFNGIVGTDAASPYRLTSITVDANGTNTPGTSAINANVFTTGDQTYGGAVTLGGGADGSNRTLTGGGTGTTVRFNGTVNGARALQLTNTNVVFEAAVGNSTRLTSVNINTAETSIQIGADIFTSGNQTYGVNPTATQNNTITLTNDVTFDANTSIVRFNGIVTSGTGSLTVTNATTRIVRGITTTGDQIYNGPVLLGQGTAALNSSVTLNASGSTIRFGDFVRSNNTTARALTITSANVEFNGAVGSVGATAAPISSLDVTAANLITIRTPTVTTTAAQTFNSNVSLGVAVGDLTLTGTLVTFGVLNGSNTVNGTNRTLTINGGAVFNGNVNNITALTVTGTSTINGNIITTGNQSYAGLNLGSVMRTLDTTGGSVIATGIVTGNAGITINASTGISMINSANTLSGVVSLINGSFGDIVLNTTAGLTLNEITNTSRNVTLGTAPGTVGSLNQTPAGVITAGTLTINSTGTINLPEDNKVGTLTINGAGGAINFTNDEALSIAGISGVTDNDITITNTGSITVSGAITTTGNTAATGSTVKLTAGHEQEISINASISCYTLSLITGSRTNQLADGTVTIDNTITVTSNNATNCGEAAAVFIWTGELAGAGNITLSNGGWVCVDLLRAYTYTGSITDNRIHFHTRLGRHIVYRLGLQVAGDPTDYDGIIGDFLYLPADSPNLGSSLNIETTGTGNVYVINVASGSNPGANARELSIKTDNGYIEFRRDYSSSGSLTLNPGTSGLQLLNANIDLTGFNSSFDSNGTVRLVGSNINTIRVTSTAANAITLGAITGNNSSSLTLYGNTILNGGTGIEALRINGNASFNTNTITADTVYVSGTSNINANITTTSTVSGNAQHYVGVVTLGVAARILAGSSGSTSTIRFDSTVNGAFGLTLRDANVYFNGQVGTDVLRLASVIVDAISGSPGITTINENIFTSGLQTYSGSVRLNAPTVTFTANAGSLITFNDTLTGINGARQLVIDTANVRFNGDVGQDDSIISIDVNNGAAATTYINADIKTIGATDVNYPITGQDYRGNVVIEKDAVLTANNASTPPDLMSVRFRRELSGNNTNSLKINGNAIFGGNTGASTNATNRLTSLEVSGTTRIITDDYIINTTGNQKFTGGVLLEASPVAFNANGAASEIHFEGYVRSDNNTPRALTVTSASVRFDGAVGTVAPLTPTPVSSLIVTGNTTINANITTTAAQAFNGDVSLGATAGDRTLTGTLVTLGILNGSNTVNGTNRVLIINGDAVFNGNVTGITTLTVTGESTIRADISTTVTTGNGQDYQGNVTLDHTITLEGGIGSAIRFGGTVDGAFGLTTTNVNVEFIGAVGGTTALASIAVNDATPNTASIFTTRINADIRTSGTQTYTGPVILTNNVNFTANPGSMVTFSGTVTGTGSTPARGLTVTTADVTFSGIVGENDSISYIDVTNGTTAINANITTTGTQTYTGNVTLGGGTANELRALTGTDITLGELTGNTHSLTITGNGVFNGGTGIGALNISEGAKFQTGDINAASVSVTGESEINVNITTSGNQTYNGAITVTNNSTIQSTSGTFTTTDTGNIKAANGLTINASGGITIGTGGINNSSSPVRTGFISLESISNININGSIYGYRLSIQTPTGIVTVESEAEIYVASNGTGDVNADPSITCAGSASIYVWAHNFVAQARVNPNDTPNIIPGTTGQLCLNVNITANVEINSRVAEGRFHIHGTHNMPCGMNLVYGILDPLINPLINPFTNNSDYYLIDANDTNKIEITASENKNIYIVAAGDINLSDLGFKTSGSGKIEFRGETNFKTALSALDYESPPEDGLFFNDADVSLQQDNEDKIRKIILNGAVDTGSSRLTLTGNNADIVMDKIGGDANNDFTINATGTVTLNGTIDDKAINNLTINSGGNVTIDTDVTTSGSVILGDGVSTVGTVTQTRSIETPQLRINSNSAVTLDNANNSVDILAVTGAGGAVQFRNNKALIIDGISGVAGNSVTITTNGNITQTIGSTINTGGTLTLDSAGEITLNNANNTVHTLNINRADGLIQFTNAQSLIVGTVNNVNNNEVRITTTSGGITQTSSTISTGGTLALNSAGVITLESDNTVNTLAITGAGGEIKFTNDEALVIAGISGVTDNDITITNTGSITVSGAITTTGNTAATGSTVKLTAGHEQEISINASISCYSLSLITGSRTNQLADGTVTITNPITVTSNNATNCGEDAAVFIWTGELAGAGSINLPNGGWVCVDLLTAYTYTGTVTPDNIHFHFRDNVNVVYTNSIDNPSYFDLLPGSYLYIKADEVTLGNNLRLYTRGTGKIYIIDINNVNKQVNTRNAMFASEGTGFIEIRGEYYSSGELSLTSGAGEIKLRNADITLTEKDFHTNGARLILGEPGLLTGTNERIKAKDITIDNGICAAVTAVNNLSLDATDNHNATGDIFITGTVGESTTYLGDLTIVNGNADFSGTSPVYARSYTQNAGSVVFNALQEIAESYSFTGTTLTVNNAMEVGGMIIINNSGLFTKAETGNDIIATGGFEQNNAGNGTSRLEAGIITDNAPITFTREIQLAVEKIELQSNGGDISLNKITRDNTVTGELVVDTIDGNINLSGDIGTDTAGLAMITITGTDINLENSIQLITDDGDIYISGNIESDTTAMDITFIAGDGDITVTGSVGSVNPLDNITITSVNNASFNDSINAASFTQFAGTGATEFNGEQDYTGGFSFTGNVLNVNRPLVTNTAISIDNSGDFTIGQDGGIETRQASGIITVTGNTFNNGSITAGPVVTPSADNISIAIDFGGDYTASADGIIIGSGTTNPDIQFNANVILGEFTPNNNRLVFTGINGAVQQLEIADSTAPVMDSVLIKRGRTVEVAAGSVIIQNNGHSLELEGELNSTAAAILDVREASWHIGINGTVSNDFTGINGSFIMGTESRLITNNFNLPGDIAAPSSFTVNNSGIAYVIINGSVNIADNTRVKLDEGDLPLLIFEMNADGQQNLIADQPLGSVYIGIDSHTILGTNNADNTVSFRGKVKILSVTAPAGLDAGNNDIIMYAGLTGNRDLSGYLHNGSDLISYTRWEITSAVYPPPPFYGNINMDNFVFRQAEGRKVSFRKDPYTNNSYPVFFEIAGNSMWREFECFEYGAVVQFSRNPNHHTIFEKFSVYGGAGSSDLDHSNYVTITRLTEEADYIGFPFIFDPSYMRPPLTPAAGGTSSVGTLGQWALPVYFPPMNLKNANEQEKSKYWNINLISAPGRRPLEYFQYVRIFFSHAYNERIPIERHSMHLDVIPYYMEDPHDGFFNFDWIELRKILYSFTEDSNGNGRLDRIRVQTNVSLNGNFDRFNVSVEGYDINTAIGINGFKMVSDLTSAFDDDSFYIYLIEKPEIDGGRTPLWSITLNESLRDAMTGRSLVGDPRIDVDMKPFDTIPPRIAYSLTLPNHPQTYIRMSEPVVSFNNNDVTGSFSGTSITGANVLESSLPYLFTWLYYPIDGIGEQVEEFNLTMPSADIDYLLQWQSPFTMTDLAALNNIFEDTPSSNVTVGKGYFQINNMVDQGRRAMDWSDPRLDDIFYIYYQAPKYPLNWGYTEYAKVYGNNHLRGHGLLTPDFSEDEMYASTAHGVISVTDVFMPPNRLLTVEMMTDIAKGNGRLVTPNSFNDYYNQYSANSVRRRVTDTLVSIPPGNNQSDDYFAWPVWARYQEAPNPDDYSDNGDFWGMRSTDTGLIWIFDGTAYLEANNIEMQARVNPLLSNFNLELFWATNIPVEMRLPREAPQRGRNAGGLWLPYPVDLQNNRLLYNFTPLMTDNETGRISSSPSSRFPLINFDIAEDSPPGFGSGNKIEFLLRFINTNTNQPSDMFITRLNIPRGGAIPDNWYKLVRPFSFDIQNIRHQRGGVTILNNVINSDRRETAYIRYQLVRPGRVTIQVYTLDGTLVRSIRRNEHRAAGEYTDTWDGTNNGGRPVARGMYFVRVVAPDIDEIRKVMVVR